MTEISDFASIVLVVTAGFALAVLSTKLTERVPVPAPAIFLLAAAAVSDIWPGVYEAVPIRTVERIAVVALIVILFNGGIDIGWRRGLEPPPGRSSPSACSVRSGQPAL
jgi:potassium/hydrogen antiporter